jgi:hypothetical protein
MHTPRILIVVLLLAPPAWAQTPQQRAEAQKKAAEGARLADQGKHADALARFREAYEMFQNPGFLYNMGIAYEALGDDVEALTMFERFLNDAQKVAPEFIADAVAQGRELKKRLAEIDVRSTQDGAQVTLDGRVVGQTPLHRLRTKPGSHTVQLSKTGFAAFGKTVSAAPEETVVVEAMMRPLMVTSEAPLPLATTADLQTAAPPPVQPALDLQAALGVHFWVAGVEPTPGVSLAPSLGVAYVPWALAFGRFVPRFGAKLGLSTISEPNARVYFTSLLADAGLRGAVTDAFYVFGDVAVGLAIISGVRPGSVLLKPEAGEVSGALSSLELRPSLGLGFSLTRALALFGEVSFVWESRPTSYFRNEDMSRVETALGLRVGL